MIEVARRYTAVGRWKGWTHGSEVTSALVDEVLLGMYRNMSYNTRICQQAAYTNRWYTPRNAMEGYVHQIGKYVDEYVEGHGKSLLDGPHMHKWLRDNDGPIGASSVFLRVLTKLHGGAKP